ncbi:MAG: SPFH domain-containing protein [Planctomycetota bacterium]
MPVHHDHAHGHAHAGEPEPFGRGLPPALSDPGQESLVRALRASFNVLRVLMIVLVVLYLLSGVFIVQPGQQGLISRFGRLRTHADEQGAGGAFREGWYAALPDPFERKYLLSGQVQTLTVTTFMFQDEKAATSKNLVELLPMHFDLTPGVDGMMLTGDRNLSHGRWEVQYRIDDALLFLKNVGESPRALEPLLQRLTETAVVQEVAGRTVEQVTRTALDDVREGVRTRLQKLLDDLDTGVQAVQVVAYTIEPAAVRDAFDNVIRAENKKLADQMQAEQDATKILSAVAGHRHADLLARIEEYGAAQERGAADEELRTLLSRIDTLLDEASRQGAGQVAVRLNAAKGEADRINQSIRREYEEFVRYLDQRRAQPGVTELGLWAQVRQQILGNRYNEIFHVPAGPELEIHVKSDPARKRELEEEEALKRQRGEPVPGAPGSTAPPPRNRSERPH